jgi:hypothetical protein
MSIPAQCNDRTHYTGIKSLTRLLAEGFESTLIKRLDGDGFAVMMLSRCVAQARASGCHPVHRQIVQFS